MTPAGSSQTATDTLSAPLASEHWPMRGSNSYQQPSTVSGEAQSESASPIQHEAYPHKPHTPMQS